MLKITTTFTKAHDNDPWVLFSSSFIAIFSQEEIATVVSPFIAFSKGLPGAQADGYTEAVLGNTAIFERTFDTAENLQNALDKLSSKSQEPTVIAKNNLIRTKMASLAVPPYTITTLIS